MISTSIISLLFGATLAQRFKVVALIPAMAIVMILAAVTEGAHSQGVWWFVKVAATAAVSLQAGFFFGILVRHVLTNEPSERPSELSSAETSTRHAARY